MPGLTNTQILGDGVHATWTYALGSIVFFFYVMIDALIVLNLASGYARAQNPFDPLLLLLIVVAAAAQIRYCWFLRVGSGGGLPRIGWTVALCVPAGASWLVAFFATERSIVAILPLWLACSLLVVLLPPQRRWPVLVGAAALTLVPVVLHVIRGVSPLGEIAQYQACARGRRISSATATRRAPRSRYVRWQTAAPC